MTSSVSRGSRIAKHVAHATHVYLKSVRPNMLRRPQFSRRPVPRKKEIKKFRHTSPPIEVDATWDVALALICPPIGLLTGLGLGSATARALGYMATSGVEIIKERAEKIREAEKEGKPEEGKANS